ncbi:conserved hypothetical protein [Verticillium alfalfae VaMs.102]|uniref:Polyamine transport protein n=1 Tax=Verticillium alfalfae (strain VaMs.102 / ATCC MYA-4576 / FGSC 10136) TaxID=526221 RepID=C9S6B3_VERA1|nr:conserved hypothetical protein [Verticillium alfalfae VaMs.102]EEY14425.1 conserved hypothetical protein [Verticillium alfalfae VaMs.102]
MACNLRDCLVLLLSVLCTLGTDGNITRGTRLTDGSCVRQGLEAPISDAFHRDPAPDRPLLSVHRRFKSRSYSSAEELTITANKSESSSSTPSVKTVVSDDTPLLSAGIPDASSVPTVETLPNPVGTKRQMFAQYLNFNRAATARPEVSGTEIVAGDFDNTPTPSTRPSFEETVVLAPGKGMASTLSSASKSAAGHRHALLKTQPGRAMDVDRDLPVPPILSREPSTDTVPFLRAYSPETFEAKPMVADERARSLRATESPSPDRIPIGPPRNPYDQQERPCIDPTLHTTESHRKVQHPGLLKGADFCDAGTSGQLAQQTSLPSTDSGIVSSTSSEPEILLVQVQRTLTGDDLCPTTIPIEIPKHAEHSRATKVRPAADLKPFYHHENINQGQQSHPAVSKVAPFDASREEEHVSDAQTSMETSSGEDSPDVQNALVPENVSRKVSAAPPDGRTEATAYHQLEVSGVSVPCLDHQHMSKVQPLQDDADVSSQEKYFAIGSDDSLHNDEYNDQVRASPATKSTATKGAALDYRRTAKWLRDLLLNRDGYSAALTERPERAENMPRGRDSNERTEPLATASARRSMSPRSLTRPSMPKPMLAPTTQTDCGNCVPCTDEACLVLPENEVRRIPVRSSSMPRATRRQQPAREPFHTCPGINRPEESSDGPDVIDFMTQYGTPRKEDGSIRTRLANRRAGEGSNGGDLPGDDAAGRGMRHGRGISLRNKSHVSLPGVRAFNLPKSHRRQPIARDWSPARKQFVATVACTSTALTGVVLGIYAGIVPSIQYYILDTTHATVYGNVGYLFGASLMSGNPHQEVVDEHDVRRHGGGLGAWLGIWTWCWIGSLSIGFLLGAAIIDSLRPAWGFYLSIILIVSTLLLNTVCPEVRRSAFRRSVAEVRTETAISRRLARGEVMMHRMKTGPKWWGQEVWHGVLLSLEMLCQPGFAIMAVYVGWIYAQVVLIILFLGSLSSRFYRMRSPFVGLMVAAIALGALVGIPFQKANLFSRARHREQNTSRMTLDNKFLWTSHLLRRTIFAIGLPLAGLIYTMVSEGPPMHPSVPAIVAALIGFLSCLAISECNGFIMETFDTSDLQPGMVGHPREESATSKKRTNYSSFPRVSAGLALCHTFAFVFAAGASTLGGLSLRNLGQRAATGVVAGILFVLTLLLLIGLIRFKEVQIIPACKSFEMDRWTEVRRKSLHRRASMPKGTPSTDDAVAEDEPWRPIVIGNPVAKTRRVNILELGPMTRWTEIRRRNKLVDANVSAGRAALDVVRDVRELVSRSPSQRSVTESTRRGHLHRSGGSGGSNDMELDNLRRQAASTSANSHHSWTTADPYVERECVLGQTVREEQEEEEPSYVKSDTSADETAAEQYSTRMRTSKVRPMYQGPPKGKGKGD